MYLPPLQSNIDLNTCSKHTTTCSVVFELVINVCI